MQGVSVTSYFHDALKSVLNGFSKSTNSVVWPSKTLTEAYHTVTEQLIPVLLFKLATSLEFAFKGIDPELGIGGILGDRCCPMIYIEESKLEKGMANGDCACSWETYVQS